jgi:type 1 fimbria pilin
MKTDKQTVRRLAGAAGLVALTGMVAVPAFAQGGTITFTGAIVAPAYEISAAAGSASVRTESVNYDGGGASGTIVSFIALPGSAPAADVALTTANPGKQDSQVISRAVAVSMVNSVGKQLAADADGHYKLDQHGAVMELKSASATPGGTPLVVMVSYN